MFSLYSSWVALPLSTRVKLAALFDIPKTGSTEVFANTIRHDGYNVKDIESRITIGSLQHKLDSDETDPIVLWKLIVDKVEGKTPVAVPVNSVAPIISATTRTEVVKPKRGRPKKSHDNI